MTHVLACRRDQRAARLAAVVAAVQRSLAHRATRRRHLLRHLLVDLLQQHEKLALRDQLGPTSSASGPEHPEASPLGRTSTKFSEGASCCVPQGT